MFKRTIALTIACAMLVFSAGCSSSGPVHEETLLEKNWGRSVETAKYNQILNPEAGKDFKAVEGLDGVSSDNTVNKYHESFKEKKKEDSISTTKLE